MFDIQQISNIIMHQQLFYGYILLQMNKILDNDLPYMACVSCGNDGEINLLYNSILLSQLTLNQQYAVIQHQIKHIAHGHIYFLNRLYNQDKKLVNIAMDMSINCTIQDIPNNAILPKHFSLPNYQTCQFYYQHLLNDDKNKIQKILSINKLNVIDHSQLSNIKQNINKQFVQDAIQVAKTAGVNTDNYSKYLQWIKCKSKVNWNIILKSNISKLTIPSDNIQSTKNKISRRFKTIPGSKKTYQYNNILVLLDTSGSMTQIMLSNMLTQIYNMSRLVNKIIVVQFDTTLKQPIIWNNKIKFKLTGRGGTVFNNDMIQYINLMYKDYIKIIITDGEIIGLQNMLQLILGKIIWLLTKKQSFNLLSQLNEFKHKLILYNTID